VAEVPHGQHLLVRQQLLRGGQVQGLGEVPHLLLQVHVLQGQPAEALLQVGDAARVGRVLLLAVDEEEHQADDDEGLDERAEEEDDAQVVAAALALGAMLLPLLLRLQVVAARHVAVAAAAVHGC